MADCDLRLHCAGDAMSDPGPGHNSKTTFAQGQLRSIVERIERLDEEKATISADIRDVYSEAKGNGFDTKILRKIIALRKKEAAEREEERAMLDLYMQSLGMLADTPLGEAAVAAAKIMTAELARLDGMWDGETGAAPDDKNFPASSKFHDSYMAGWHEGNSRRLAEAQKVAVQ